MAGTVSSINVILLVSAIIIPNDALESVTYTLGDDESIEVAMNTFPESCCHSFSATITYTGSKQQHMRMNFTDIDVPDKSIILFTDENNEKLRDQPVYKRGTYIRQGFAFDKSVVKVLFQPPNESEESTYYAGFKIMVSTQEGDLTDWKFWPLSERCPRVENTGEGGIVQIRSDPTLYKYDVDKLPSILMYDCIWVFKVPQRYMGRDEFEPKVFVSVLDWTIPDSLMRDTHVEVRRGKSSQGVPLEKLSADSDMSSIEEDEMTWTSQDAIYVRFQMPYTAENTDSNTVYSVRMGYGIYTPSVVTSNECDFDGEDGVSCVTAGWCVPETYKCNGVQNCPDFEDERNFKCGDVKRQRARKAKTHTSVTTAAPTIQVAMPRNPSSGRSGYDGECSFWEKQCYSESSGSYLCEDMFETCPGSHCESWEAYCKDGLCKSTSTPCRGSDQCSYGEKRCPDGRCISSASSCNCQYDQKQCVNGNCVFSYDRCPEDPCPYYSEFKCDGGEKCVPDSYKCDGYTDCTDAADEADCASNSEPPNALFLADASGGVAVAVMSIILPIFVVCFLLICCYACCNINRTNSGTTINTPGYTGTQMTAVTSTGPRPVVSGYAPVPSSDQTRYPATQPSAPPSNDVTSNNAVVANPPQYNEALDTNTYPVAPSEEEPPPPSYESVVTNGYQHDSRPSNGNQV